MKMRCTVEITPVDKDGNPVGETFTKENDMFTKNFGLWLRATFKPANQDVNEAPYVIPDVDGTLRTNYAWTTAQVSNLANADSPGGFTVGIGTGVTAPTREDTDLEAQIGTWDSGTISQAQWLPASSIIKFSGIIFVAADQNVTECGLAAKIGTFYFLFARDTFPAVSVSAQNYASVTYTISL